MEYGLSFLTIFSVCVEIEISLSFFFLSCVLVLFFRFLYLVSIKKFLTNALSNSNRIYVNTSCIGSKMCMPSNSDLARVKR